jgi:hypothetical protein
VFFACIYVPNFLAQAAVRLDPTAAASPFAVVAGDPPQVRVLALDDCLYGLQATVPHLTQSSLHRCLQAISNLLWCNCAQSELNHLSAKPQMPGSQPHDTRRFLRSYPNRARSTDEGERVVADQFAWTIQGKEGWVVC